MPSLLKTFKQTALMVVVIIVGVLLVLKNRGFFEMGPMLTKAIVGESFCDCSNCKKLLGCKDRYPSLLRYDSELVFEWGDFIH